MATARTPPPVGATPVSPLDPDGYSLGPLRRSRKARLRTRRRPGPGCLVGDGLILLEHPPHVVTAVEGGDDVGDREVTLTERDEDPGRMASANPTSWSTIWRPSSR